MKKLEMICLGVTAAPVDFTNKARLGREIQGATANKTQADKQDGIVPPKTEEKNQ